MSPANEACWALVVIAKQISVDTAADIQDEG